MSINGATASNLLGTGAPIDATFTGAPATNNQSVVYSASTGTGAAVAATHQNAFISASEVSSGAVNGLDSNPITGSTALTGASVLELLATTSVQGSAWRSSLPLSVSGIFFSTKMRLGTM